MKTILLKTLLVWSMSLSALFAQTIIPNVGSADDLRAQAAQGPREFLDVVLRLKENVRELRDEKSFNEFFSLLNDFEKLAGEYRMDDIYPGVVAELGRDMVLHGNRWLKVSEPSVEKILSYQKWADIVVANRLQSQIEEELTRLKDEEKLKFAFSNILILKKWAQKNFSEDLYLVPGYERLASEISVKALRSLEFNQIDQWTYWLPGLTTQQSLQDFIYDLNQRILTNELNQDLVNGSLEVMRELGQQVTQNENLSSTVTRDYGVLVTDLFINLTLKELTIDSVLMEEILTFLDISSLRALVYQWVNPPKGASDSYSLHLLELSKVLLSRLQSSNLSQSSRELERFVSQRLSPVFVTEQGLEGTYRLAPKSISSKKTWLFTIIREREDRIIAALSSEDGYVHYSFFNFQYNLKKGVFLASEYIPDDEPYANATVEVSFNDEGEIELKLPLAFRTSRELKGKKIESYPHIMGEADMEAEAIEGLYEGVMMMKNGPRNYKLGITAFDEYSVGRLESESGVVTIELDKGNDGKIGYIYLTSGRTPKGTWFHLRLKKVDDELHGIAISGGMGEIAKVVFKKVD